MADKKKPSQASKELKDPKAGKAEKSKAGADLAKSKSTKK